MATINTGQAAAGRRAVDHDIPLIPFIDFLLCLVAFLLVTAVWSQMARLESSALVPGQPHATKDEDRKQLHVRVAEGKFRLEWRQGDIVVDSQDIARQPVVVADGQTRFPELERQVAEAWKQGGVHRSPTDPQSDTAVLHAPNTLVFGELAAVMDALHGPSRAYPGGERSALSVSFAVD